MDEDLKKYRSILIDASQKAQESFDKTVLTLSGGALGISFAFVKDFVEKDQISLSHLLFGSWISWGLSMLCVLVSFFCSQKALSKTVEQVDRERIYSETPGGRWTCAVDFLNVLGGLFFIVGLVSAIVFMGYNFKLGKGN